MRKVAKVGVISACWEYAAYDAETDAFLGYFEQKPVGQGPLAILDEMDRVVLGADAFEVVSVDESAWD